MFSASTSKKITTLAVGRSFLFQPSEQTPLQPPAHPLPLPHIRHYPPLLESPRLWPGYLAVSARARGPSVDAPPRVGGAPYTKLQEKIS